MRFATLNTNEGTFFTHVNSSKGISVGNIELHQWIITTNIDIVGSYILFNDEEPFDPIRLNCILGEKNDDL